MFNLERNTFVIYYKLYLGQEEIVDEWGNKTGSFAPVYGEMESESLSVSPNKGRAEEELFGSLDVYDRTMTTANVNCKIDEDSILWLDGQDTNGPHNYIVTKRAPWKNSISYAVKKVNVSA